MLLFVAFWVRGRIERAMEAQIAGNLTTILEANTEALRAWAGSMKSLAEVLAEDNRVREAVPELLGHTNGPSSESTAAKLHTYLQSAVESRGFTGYAVLDSNLVLVASTRNQLIGLKLPPEYAPLFSTCFAGTATVTRPFPILSSLPEGTGNIRPDLPLMFAAAPIRSTGGQVVAALGLRILPESDFTRILATARSGHAGETYAFDRKGLLLSQSRFEDELKRLGLLKDSPDASSVLGLELRDPLVDLRQAPSPKRRAELPLTRAVSEAIAGHTGVDARGYRGYRGVPVVGAWTWLPEFDLGLATELDVAEAFAPVRPIRIGFWALFGLLTLGSAVVYLLMRVARQAALRATQLGQYAIDERIGTGGFGTVYRGHHALMRRPVAVKLLSPTANANSIARFEREVQLTCKLTHPNTIALYDYGHTPEGVFYYAMEYLEGLNLGELIKDFGPQPEGRVIHILRQVCASLAEAHSQGLVHRDIKPQNIFLTRRGGIPDFVKVLDFGLVKARNVEGQVELTAAHVTVGTPLYMSPEAIRNADTVDALSDLYSLGAVGYELLTGQPVFPGATVGEVLIQQLGGVPDKPSARLEKPVSPDLEEVILLCLAKTPKTRPATASVLDDMLAKCVSSTAWTRAYAEAWWNRRFPTNPEGAKAATLKVEHAGRRVPGVVDLDLRK